MEEEPRICFSDPIEVFTKRGQLIGHYFLNGKTCLEREMHFPIIENNKKTILILGVEMKPIDENRWRMVFTVRKKFWEYLQYLDNFVELTW